MLWTGYKKIQNAATHLDCSIFYGDSETWDKYVGSQETQEETDTTPQADKYKVEDHVIFSTCYKSSSDPNSAAIPAASMLQNHGIITYIQEGAKNPYLLDDGLCWVNDGDIRGYYKNNLALSQNY